jgi:hypothetical protein
MNLNEIWAGNDYAYFEYKGRNEPYRSGAPRVKVIRVYKRAEYGKVRESGFAQVMFVDKETGEPKTDRQGNHVTNEVRARDIAMLWDAYVEERDYRAAQAEKIAKEREEREAEETRITMQLTELMTERYGIPKEAIYNVTASGVHLSRTVLERELGLVNTE